MFPHFQLSTIAWLLLHFLDCSYQTTYGEFFPSVPGEVTGQSFPVTLKTNASSDLVIVKCPAPQYKHTKTNDRFVQNEKLRDMDIFYYTDDKVFAWAPMLYNSSGPNFIHCGDLDVRKIDSSGFDDYEWTYNLNWEKQPDPMQIAKPKTISTKIYKVANKCGDSEKSVVVYHKNKENSIQKFELEDKVSAHVNDLFYYFLKPANDDGMEVKTPCAIIRAVNEPPEILIKGLTSTPIIFKGLDIHVIKQKKPLGSYSIELSMGNEASISDYYKGEEVKMKRMMYTRTGIEEIPSSNEVVTSSFSIQGYQLLKFSYDCPTTDGTEMISRIFYLGPESENYVFPNENTVYLSNETAIQPNCSIQRITFGYLDSVTVSGITTNLNDLMDDGATKNSFKRVKDFVFMVDAKEDKVTLECFYITPNGNVTFVKTFLKGKKVFIGRNDKGEEIYDVKSNDDISKEYEKNKELETQNKSLLSKLKSKIGPIGAYAVIIIIALVALTIILVVGILLYKKFVKEWIAKKGFFKKNEDEPKVAGKKKSVN